MTDAQLLPATAMMHSGSTACPASSTKMWVKWPRGIPPDTSLTVEQCNTLIFFFFYKRESVKCHLCSVSLPASCDQSCNHNCVFHQTFFIGKHETVLSVIPVATLLKCASTSATTLLQQTCQIQYFFYLTLDVF